jgi:glycosyltransferase involved in cell wall biosynthesis
MDKRPGNEARAPQAGPRAAAATTGAARGGARPRVLIVDQSGELGGAELALLPVAAALADRAEAVLLADGPFRGRLQAEGVKVSVLSDPRVLAIRKNSMGPRVALSALAGLWSQVRALGARGRNCDVLYLNTQKALVLGALAKTICRRPVVWHLHDIVSRDHFGRAQLAIVRQLVRHRVDFVIANSQAAADSLTSLAGWPAEKMVILHNGISASPFDAVADADRDVLRRRFDLPAGVPLAGIFGRLAQWKGQHVMIEAVAAVPGMHVAIVGSAMFGEQPYEASIRAQVERLGLGNRVHFLGFQDDVPALMKAMDVIVHASVAPEPFGRVVVEGMLAARPVVAAAAGGVVEIITDGVDGMLVPPGDVAALGAALTTLMNDPARRAALGRTARTSAGERFSLERYIAEIVRCIDGVAAGGGHAATA